MSLDSLLTLSSRVDHLSLRFRVRMLVVGSFDEQAGTLLHGALGWAMREAAPRLWQAAYGPLEQGEVRPLSLHLPALPCQWRAGDSLTFGLSLFGALARDLDGMLVTIQQMGRRGWGAQRIGFELVDVVQQCPQGQRLIWHCQSPGLMMQPQRSGLEEALMAGMTLCGDRLPTLVQLQTRTNLHLKEQGKVATTAPSAMLLGRAICRRLLALVGPHSEAERLGVQANLNGLDQITLCWDHCRAAPLHRYSARQRQHHQIEGLTGEWAYQGKVIHLVPWLALASWLQLGNKTSFGYGSIKWQLACLP